MVRLCDMFPTVEAGPDASMPYCCRGCRKVFPVRMGNALRKSTISLRKWIFAIHPEMVNLKGVGSPKLHGDITVAQKTAWFMLHRIGEAWKGGLKEAFEGSVGIGETFIGGKRANMSDKGRRRRAWYRDHKAGQSRSARRTVKRAGWSTLLTETRCGASPGTFQARTRRSTPMGPEAARAWSGNAKA